MKWSGILVLTFGGDLLNHLRALHGLLNNWRLRQESHECLSKLLGLSPVQFRRIWEDSLFFFFRLLFGHFQGFMLGLTLRAKDVVGLGVLSAGLEELGVVVEVILLSALGDILGEDLSVGRAFVILVTLDDLGIVTIFLRVMNHGIDAVQTCDHIRRQELDQSRFEFIQFKEDVPSFLP